MSTTATNTPHSLTPAPQEIGYAVVSGGDQAAGPVALVVPSGCSPLEVRVDVAREIVTLRTLGGEAVLRNTPAFLRKALQQADSDISIFAVDTLTDVQGVWFKGKLILREDSEAGIRDALNSFLGKIAAGRTVDATKYRVRFRHPEIEAFIRKMLLTLAKGAPKLGAVADSADIKPLSDQQTGPTGVAVLALSAMAKHPALKAIAAGFEGNDTITFSAAYQPTLADFALVHSAAYAYLTRLNRQSETVINGFASFGATLLKKDEQIDQRVLSAADSLFLQSYRDSFACLALSRLDSKHALALLDSVVARRSQAGDFRVFAQAPMSHNTAEALAVTRQLLASQVAQPRSGLKSIHEAALGIAIAAAEGEISKKIEPATATSLLQAAERTLAVMARQAA